METDRVEVTIWGIVPGAHGNSVILADASAGRVLQIVIGVPEALAILFELKSQSFERPMTHDLFLRAFDSLGVEVEDIFINDLQDGTFYARIGVTSPDGGRSIDARPSDAIAIALRAGVPIYVAESVMAEAAYAAPGDLEQQIEAQLEEVTGAEEDEETGGEAPSEDEMQKFRSILRDAGLD
jgi:hypothetical protein